MAKNQSTYTLKIDAELGNLQKTLNEAKSSLATFMQSGNAPKGLEKAFEKINDLLGKISDKTGKPLDIKGLTSTGKDLETIQEVFHAIIRLLGDFNDLSDDVKLSFLSADEQKKINDITAALKQYGGAMEEVAKKSKLLETAQKQLGKDEGALGRAKKKVGNLENERTVAIAKLKGAEGKLNAAKGLENANPQDIAKYEAKVEELRASLGVLDKNLEEANAELIRAQGAYDASAKSVSDLEKEIKKTSGDALKSLKKEAKDLGVSLDGLNGHDAATQVQILTNRLNELKQKGLNGAKQAFDNVAKGSENAEQAVKGLSEEVKEATKVTEQMNEAAAQREAFEGKIKQFLGLQGAAQLMRVALRDALSTITELDATMTEMAVVTDLSVGDYWDQLPGYSQRASELGVSINDAYKAATLYYQQGLKSNEVTALSNETLKMAKIAGIDAAEATDKMTAALRGFNMELNEASAQKIADVYSELAAITAADVDEISTAMTKTASIASSAGMEFETTAAFLSQIIETTRESAETAGTALKTVIARFQELKKSPSEIGEVDGEIVDANAIETALRSVGVSLRDSAGQFRELDDVFLELSSKWDGLDKNTQRYIATIAAGSRQQSRFIAMMQDYGRTQELVTAASNSAGASQKQFEKTMESLEAKVEKLKNAWHEFTMGIMNSDLVKFGVDVLTKFLEVVNKATGALDGIGGSLTKIISVVGIFKLGKQIFDKFMPTISGFFTNVTKEAYTGGLNAGKAFQQGLEDSKKQDTGDAQNEETEGKKSENKEDVKRTGWQKLGDKTIGLNKWQEASGHNKNRKKELEELRKLTKGTKEYEEQQNKVLAEGKKQWAAYGQALGSVGQTLTGVGMGMSAIGGILSSLGLEEAGEAFATFGNYVTIAGTALMGFAQVLQYIPVLSNAIMTHPVIAIVVGVLAAILIIITAIVANINNSSPEAKLKKAQEVAEKAGAAADRAKEAYDGLASAINDLDDGYETLEDLTKGTEEWYKALRKINSQVIDLVTKYPELAQFVKNEDGVLTIDLDDKKVQDVLKKYEAAAINSANVAMLSEVEVAKRNNDVSYSKLSDDITSTIDDKNATNELAIALASGKVMPTHQQIQEKLMGYGYAEGEAQQMAWTLAKNVEELQKYGEVLNTVTMQETAAYDSIASSVVSMVDTMGMAEDRIDQMFNVVDGDAYKQKYDEWMNRFNADKFYKGHSFADIMMQDDSGGDWHEHLQEATKNMIPGGITEEMVNAALSSSYEGAQLLDNGEIKYKKDGKWVTEPIDIDTIKESLANYLASDFVQGQAKHYDNFMNSMSIGVKAFEDEDPDKRKGTLDALNRALTSESGDDIVSGDVDKLKKLLEDGSLETYYNENIKGTEMGKYFSFDYFKSKIESAVNGADFQMDSANKILGLNRNKEQNVLSGTTAGAAHSIAQVIEGLNNVQTTGFVEKYNAIADNLTTDEQRAELARQMGSLKGKETQREEWEAVQERLASSGIDISGLMDTADLLDARYSDTYLKNMGVSDSLISQYQAASGEELKQFHATFSKWKKDYDIVTDEAAKAEHELIEQVIDAMVEGYEKQIDAQEEAYNAMTEANEQLISRISEKINEIRAKREDDKTREELSSSRNQLSYLMMDTSGGNALGVLDLEKQIAESEQVYEDSLVDQALQKLEDANTKAAEQRERQIELARQQLEAYKNSESIAIDARNIINDAKEALTDGKNIESTALGKLLTPDRFTSAFASSEFWTKLNQSMSLLIDKENGGTGNGGTGNGGNTTNVHITTFKGAGPALHISLEAESNVMRKKGKGFKTGGLADFTGPAWLDGTPSKPEYVLNAAQTERFFSLIDVLEGYDTKSGSSKSSGDNYFDININVEKLEDDYDVEQMADKIRRMIYDDATYRNVNSINHIR